MKTFRDRQDWQEHYFAHALPLDQTSVIVVGSLSFVKWWADVTAPCFASGVGACYNDDLYNPPTACLDATLAPILGQPIDTTALAGVPEDFIGEIAGSMNNNIVDGESTLSPPSVEVGEDTVQDQFAFLVSTKSVRRLAVPSKVATLLTKLGPAVTRVSSGALNVGYTVPYLSFLDTAYPVLDGTWRDYGSLNEVEQFTDPANILDPDAEPEYYIGPDYTGGAFQFQNYNNKTDTQMYENYSTLEYRFERVRPDFTKIKPPASLRLASDRVPLPEGTILYGPKFPEESLDAGKIAYCRQMLLAMGFTEADLIP
jgi:hypothetical protein